MVSLVNIKSNSSKAFKQIANLLQKLKFHVIFCTYLDQIAAYGNKENCFSVLSNL